MTGEQVLIRWERPGDHAAVRELHRAAFGGDEVPRLVDVLRVTPAPLAPRSFVAVDPGDEDAGGEGPGDEGPGDEGAGDEGAGGGPREQVVGHVMLTAGRLDARERLVDILVLSPLAVLPQAQGRGIGSRLVAHALAAAARTTAPLLFVEGDPRYYGSRGFERADLLGFRPPSLRIPPAAFQVARLPGWQPWMTGTLVYADPFWALDCVGLRDPLLAELTDR